MTKPASHTQSFHAMLTYTFVSCVFAIGITACFWSIINILTPFIAPIVIIIIGITMLQSLILSTIYIFQHRRSSGLISFTPLIINILTTIIIIFVPLSQWVLYLDFHLNYERRMEVVRMVESGELRPNVGYNGELIRLPGGYRWLSQGGGDIIVRHEEDTTIIMFYTFRGILDNFSAFVYRSDNHAPSIGGRDGFFEIWKLHENWFWAAAT